MVLEAKLSKAIAFAWRPFLPIFKMLSFLEYYVSFRTVFLYNNYNLVVDSFLRCFRQFYFLTQSYDFAKVIAFAWRPFLPMFKMV